MSRIEKLTKAQEKRLIEFRKEWLDIGLCCEPADFDRAEKQITFLYEKLGKKKGESFVVSTPKGKVGYKLISIGE